MEREFTYLGEAVPDYIIIWVDVLQRCNWNAPGYSLSTMERKQKRKNRFGRQQASLHPKFDLLSVDIDMETPGFYRPGVSICLTWAWKCICFPCRRFYGSTAKNGMPTEDYVFSR